jgi:UPF0271 protein
MIFEKKVNTIQGDEIPIEANTICIHGDGLNALPIASAIHSCLKENKIEIKYP